MNLQGGVSTGKTHENDCDILTALPEMRNMPAIAAANLPASQRPLQYCDRQSPYLTQAKLFGVYVIPKVEVQVSGTFRSVPGQINGATAENFVNVALVATNAFLATNSTLGRPLSGNAPNTTLQILAPHQHFLDRRNELDFRVGKLLRAAPASCAREPRLSSTRSTRTPSSTSTRLQPGGEAADWRPTCGRRRS